MAPGRPLGSNNKSKYHKAGGRRIGAGRPPSGGIVLRGQTSLGNFINNSRLVGGMPRESPPLPSAISNLSNITEDQDEVLNEIGDDGERTGEQPADLENEIREKQIEQQQQRIDLVTRIREIARENNNLLDGNLDVESEESDDESVENYEEDQEDEALDAQKTGQPRRTLKGYMPPCGSVLYNYLKEIKEKVVKRSGIAVENGQKWFIPQTDPISRPCVGEAELWYQSEAWVFVWEPFFQFSSLTKLKDISCVHCHENSTYTSNMYCWRPMFYYDKIVWLLHRRFLCSRCKHSCAGIDPRFLSQLPTRVLDRFEFATTIGGPGMHISMVYMFSNLSTKGITYGSFSNMINELQRIRYNRCQLSYLDSLSDRKKAAEFYQMREPALFSSFLGPGEFNGICLTRKLVKACFFSFMNVHERYMQAFFQTCVDEAVTADHTHKYSNKITVSGRGGAVFTASYTTMSLGGLVSMSRLTYTKSNSELEPLVRDFKTVRENMGLVKLKRFESDNLDGDNEIDTMRSRGKEDLWHMFDRLPLPRDCPFKPLIYQLLIHGTWDFVKEDVAGVEEFLKNKNPPVNDLIQHFCFNREWWKQRVRMYTPKATIHAANVRRIQAFLAENSATKPFYSAEVAQYFDTFAQKCEEGKYEELCDVSLFRHAGVDSAGLDMWLRLRGTVRDENLHQKMKTCLGPLGIGARSAHYILVNLCFRYNVSARIRRCGDVDHGHPYLNLVDRIQIRMQEIFNVLLFPRHQNVLQTKFNKFIAVGIGPLCYSEDFVAQGEPLPELKGDIYFIAKQMNLKCPPLPIVTKEEINLYNSLMINKPNPTERDFCEYAKTFLQHSDGIKIFPKLPSMLKQYYKQWHKNQQVKAARLAVGSSYSELLKSLSSIRVEAALLDSNRCFDQSTSAEAAETCAENENNNFLFVPSVAGPHQAQYKSTKQQEQTQRRCFWWPYCGTVDICGGWTRDRCSNFSKGNFNTVSIEQLQNAKTNALNERRMIKIRSKK